MQKDKYRVHEVAKDFNVDNKEVIDILAKVSDEPKKHMTALEERELDMVFETMTQANQVSSFDEYFAPKPKTEKKAEPKAEKAEKPAKKEAAPKKPRAPKAEKTEVKAEPKAEVKAEPKKEAKAEVKAEPKKEAKAEVKKEAKAEPKAEKAEVKAEVKPEPKSEVKAEVKPEPKAEVKAEQKPAQKPQGDKPAYNNDRQPRQNGDRPQRTYNNNGDRQNNNNNGERPQRTYNNNGDRQNNNNGDRPQRTYNNNGDRQNNNNGDRQQRTYNNNGDRPNYNNNGDRQQRSYNNNGDRPNYNNGDRPQRTYNNNGDRPNYNNNGDRPQRTYNNNGDRPNYNNGDRPQRNYNNNGDRPNYNNRQGGYNNGGYNNNNKPQKPANPANNPTSTLGKTQTTATGEKFIPARTKGEKLHVDTRASNVNLDKYNERYEKIAPVDRMNDNSSNKQKLKQKSQQYRRQGMRNSKRETEAERLKRIAEERAKKQILIKIEDEITVGELAALLKMTAAEVIKKLFALGVMATVNQTIDYDTAEIVATELGAKVEKKIVVTIEERIIDDSQDDEGNLEKRDPVVVVMGHVDHGKTSILDAIKNTAVTETEAGGITQHIGAYRVDIHGNTITFLDTPGHAAFTSMRARGAKATDIAVLVVAADDGIMPQTIEAINHAKAAEVQVIVAINKMDKVGANPEKIKQQLTEHGLVPEEWGGDTICVPVSAKTREGIDTLLDTINLVAEMQELKANPNRAARGVVIEARLDKSRGPIATLLVQNGTLNSSDIIVAGTSVGRIRVMQNEKGRKLKVAGPSVPVEIMGLDETPNAGDTFDAVTDEKLARELVEQRKQKIKDEQFNLYNKITLDSLFDSIKDGEVKNLNIIVKADVQGSVEAVKQNLEKIKNEEVRVRVIHGGVGVINDSDVMLASVSNAIIVGFNVRADANAQATAERDGVEMRMYRVIYDCIEEIEAAMKGMLAPKFRDVEIGKVEVRNVMNLSSVGKIAGSYVLEGKITRNAKIRIVREGIVIADDDMSSLRRFKDDVREVSAGYECGISLEKFIDIKVGDIFEAYLVEEYQED